jgi:hypothetical protein
MAAESSTAALGATRWTWFAAFEVMGIPRHPAADRMLGKMLVHPAASTAYMAALLRLRTLQDGFAAGRGCVHLEGGEDADPSPPAWVTDVAAWSSEVGMGLMGAREDL